MVETETEQRFADFNWRGKSTLIEGPDAEKLYHALLEDGSIRGVFYNRDKKRLAGSGSFGGGHINRLVRNSGFWVATPSDNIYETVFPLTCGSCVSSLNALDVKDKIPEYEKDQKLRTQIINLVEETNGRAEFPFRIQGFYLEQVEDKSGYGVKIVPSKNFKIIQDKRLGGHPFRNFSVLDENGMIVSEEAGKFSWWPNQGGLSGVLMDRRGDLIEEGCYLEDFNVKGGLTVLLRN